MTGLRDIEGMTRILYILILLACTVYASTNEPPLPGTLPYAPIHMNPPAFPKMMSETGAVRYITFTNYVYECEYQTNSASAVITETRTVSATNYVPRYPKLLYIQPLRRESLTDPWESLGEELIFKLGDSTNEFYSAELRIE